ncbi:MAG: TadE/TadG family type IV pilus assembly protein [Candidatus Dormibacteria bacterium]
MSAPSRQDRPVQGRRRRHRAQSTLEFALVAPLFLASFFGAVDAALWAVQEGAAVSAAEQAARLAAAASGSPTSAASPTAAVLVAGVRTQLQQALFGVRVVAWCGPAAGACDSAGVDAGTCPRLPADVEAALGPRTVAVCDVESPPSPACPAAPLPPPPRCGDPPTVTVHVIGYLASLVPAIGAFGWRGGEIPIDVVATTHTLRFAT